MIDDNGNNGKVIDRSDISRRRALEMLATSMGSRLKDLLLDDLVIEIMRNPNGTLWVEKVGKGMYKTDINLSDSDTMRVIHLIARMKETTCTAENPILSAELPENGYRFEANIPPITIAPSFVIRKHSAKIFSLSDYIKAGILTEHQVEVIKKAVTDRKNILVVGGTGSGKTTLVNAILQVFALTEPEAHLLIIEDTRELRYEGENVSCLKASDDIADMTRCLKSVMRQRPSRIVVGEVRGPEALAFMKSWNTGHPGGLGTIHANSCLEALYRIEMLIEEAGVTPSKQFIARVCNFIIFITKNQQMERKVESFKTVVGLTDKGEYILKDV
jgi:type IV secretion system protein VirB11